ncbi:SET and MYND domain-containing protein 4 [Chionoecetes opilio]|uniref:SET and MYND domain-containing protein 4 n=1 Tax=Chionoecetes opilio TaxID=41210 RepID=A0A8J4Y333_CHIOP|nr:SET and MYND domain-containing protein 4 [Chionoecetes opilio]
MEEVGKGSEVVVEKPYAAILLPKHQKTHCHTCFSKIVNSYPDFIFMLHNREEEVEGRTAGIGESGVYNGPDMVNKYRAVYHLLPHLNRCLLEDQLQYCLAAILLATAISDRTNFIEENIDENTHKADLDVSQLASVVMRHIAQLVSNAHAITQIMPAQCESDSKVEQIQQVRVACAIYPTSSMMNHSCKPNIINSALSIIGEEAMRKGDLPDAVSLLKRAIQIGSKVYLPENQYFLSVRDSLARALADSGKPV